MTGLLQELKLHELQLQLQSYDNLTEYLNNNNNNNNN